ncbi:hypothetical protein SAMN02745751_03709 [Dethiosulfatibacter aminovorans DSM 17477]|uniref:Uncharacterized protein n=1 Tax=Dethiosulfatibacter aminovorans DSM 17477 TaxID=1121476 RepID=A0A1M6N8I2_9FIRM|nr:hypothetical protein [Dethiosulfatibacter aminovorans]SHJ92040.1 hypothetical protein SAMN02745751_03709 [Dethiosulfatibacter aminovorans DSM 17477]
MKKRIVIFITLILVFTTILSLRSFRNIINYDYDEIAAIKMRDAGGILYVTEDKELIGQFISMMDKSRYLKFIDTNVDVGGSFYSLFSDNNEIVRISFHGDKRVNINKKSYIVLKDIEEEIIQFFDLIYIEENIIGE